MSTITPEYWRGRVDQLLEELGDEQKELRIDVDELMRTRWRFSGIVAVVIVIGSLVGGALSMAAAYLLLAALHHPA